MHYFVPSNGFLSGKEGWQDTVSGPTVAISASIISSSPRDVAFATAFPWETGRRFVPQQVVSS